MLPDLVNLVIQEGFNETLFSKNKRSELRKCLYYLDEPDYKLDFFESIVSKYFKELEEVTTEKKKNKNIFIITNGIEFGNPHCKMRRRDIGSVYSLQNMY